MITAHISHRIRRQRWAVQAASADEAMRWREQLRDGHHELALAFEQALDATDVGNRHLHIPSLFLRCRVNSVAQLGEQLPALLAQALAEALPRSATHETDTNAEWSMTESASAEVLEPWLHYLHNGSLPWFVAHADRQQVRLALRPTAERQRQWLGQALANAVTPPQRLLLFWRWLQPLADADWLREISSLFAEIAPATADLAATMAALLLADTGLNRHQRLQLLTVVLLQLSQQQAIAPRLRQFAAAMTSSGQSLPENSAAIWRRLLPWLIARADSRAPVDARAGTVRKSTEHAEPRAITIAAAPARLQQALQPYDELLHAAVAQPVFPATLISTTTAATTVTVSHAGLLLLHPFLPKLFASTGIMPERGAGIPVAALPRAAALLHFLATGAEQLLEYEFGFIKILLGLAVDAPLPVAEGLVTETDKAEAEVLLQAVIQHWSALKQTSVTGLRVSFLQRQGLLRAEPDGWRVHIEREAFDVLLDFLPWGIGVIKLPWMSDAIHTAW